VRFTILLTLALAWASLSAPATAVGQGAPSTRVDRLLARMTLTQKVDIGLAIAGSSSSGARIRGAH
jgi:hypothetical protein